MLNYKVFGATIAAYLSMMPNLAFSQVILTVTNQEASTKFTHEELSSLPQVVLLTANDYVDQPTSFQGPLLRSVLEASGIGRDAKLNMIALNDFTSTVPASDAFDYDVILAILREGKTMPVREKGPVWVIYPMDDNPELRNDLYNDRLVWQLKEISVE
ncbi:hypothetical protein [Sulfitobacter sp. R86518]|jgi:hypothetical protein|uniref:hypothetical protein n=1 Tax=Sulfitobacter sp. R86518 TaxID=3093858 RepID=UPI0036DDD275|tara:strand:- start:4816 stop:5289 length:474 start_codon:yes stop_codon:yes gene_type:complete